MARITDRQIEEASNIILQRAKEDKDFIAFVFTHNAKNNKTGVGYAGRRFEDMVELVFEMLSRDEKLLNIMASAVASVAGNDPDFKDILLSGIQECEMQRNIQNEIPTAQA